MRRVDGLVGIVAAHVGVGAVGHDNNHRDDARRAVWRSIAERQVGRQDVPAPHEAERNLRVAGGRHRCDLAQDGRRVRRQPLKRRHVAGGVRTHGVGVVGLGSRLRRGLVLGDVGLVVQPVPSSGGQVAVADPVGQVVVRRPIVPSVVLTHDVRDAVGGERIVSPVRGVRREEGDEQRRGIQGVGCGLLDIVGHGAVLDAALPRYAHVLEQLEPIEVVDGIHRVCVWAVSRRHRPRQQVWP